MPYNSLTSRVDAAADLARQITPAILGDVETMSTVLALGRQVPVLTKDSRVPVLTQSPSAYFVTGDSGLKQSSNVVFENKSITAEEIAVIVPVPDSVLEDSEFAIFDTVKPLIVRSFARLIDKAILFGVEKPASWPIGLVQAATAAGNTVSSTADAAGDLLAAAELVANDEYAVTGAAVRTGWEHRAARERTMAFTANPIGAGQPFAWSVGGVPIRTSPVFWDRTAAEAILADWRNVLYGVRREMTFEAFNTGVLTDENGAITHNLLQSDLSALRCTMRLGWHLATPATQSGPATLTKTPVALVNPPSTAS